MSQLPPAVGPSRDGIEEEQQELDSSAADEVDELEAEEESLASEIDNEVAFHDDDEAFCPLCSKEIAIRTAPCEHLVAWWAAAADIHDPHWRYYEADSSDGAIPTEHFKRALSVLAQARQLLHEPLGDAAAIRHAFRDDSDLISAAWLLEALLQTGEEEVDAVPESPALKDAYERLNAHVKVTVSGGPRLTDRAHYVPIYVVVWSSIRTGHELADLDSMLASNLDLLQQWLERIRGPRSRYGPNSGAVRRFLNRISSFSPHEWDLVLSPVRPRWGTAHKEPLKVTDERVFLDRLGVSERTRTEVIAEVRDRIPKSAREVAHAIAVIDSAACQVLAGTGWKPPCYEFWEVLPWSSLEVHLIPEPPAASDLDVLHEPAPKRHRMDHIGSNPYRAEQIEFLTRPVFGSGGHDYQAWLRIALSAMASYVVPDHFTEFMNGEWVSRPLTLSHIYAISRSDLDRRANWTERDIERLAHKVFDLGPRTGIALAKALGLNGPISDLYGLGDRPQLEGRIAGAFEKAIRLRAEFILGSGPLQPDEIRALPVHPAAYGWAMSEIMRGSGPATFALEAEQLRHDVFDRATGLSDTRFAGFAAGQFPKPGDANI